MSAIKGLKKTLYKTFNQRVVGSSPAGLTTYLIDSRL
jgi:hypothetical protein